MRVAVCVYDGGEEALVFLVFACGAMAWRGIQNVKLRLSILYELPKP